MAALLVCVLIGVVDLIEAYRQLSVDLMERWASGFTFLDEQNNLKFGVDKRFGFGATLHPLCFCRLSNANVTVFDQKLTKSSVMPVPLQQRWRDYLQENKFSLADGVMHRQIHGRAGTYAERRAARDDEEQEDALEEDDFAFNVIQ